ncbi:MAG: hypothetical protein IT303_14095 [Dehalococcoidia bacterium]|nr:hypothetical protein [Dehalococcoidia bacterium]
MLVWLGVDVLGAGMLFCGGLLAAAAWYGRGRHGSAYWLIAGIGLVYLAIDERLSLHERIGRRISDAGVANPPGVNHMDDVVLLALAAAGALVTLVFWREVVRHRTALPALVVGAGFTAAALAVDALAPVEGRAPRMEELLELAGQGSLLAAMWYRWSEERAGVTRLEAAPAPEPVAAFGPIEAD